MEGLFGSGGSSLWRRCVLANFGRFLRKIEAFARFLFASALPLGLSPGASGQGYALWHSGPGAPGDGLGVAVEGLGDLDGDGFDDFAVGAPQSEAGGPGYVKVVSGGPGLAFPWSPLLATPPGGPFGSRVASAGDVNADGVPDIAVGAPGAPRVTVFSGSDGSEIWSRAPQPGDGPFAASVASVGDLNGDSIPDLVVGIGGNGWPILGRARLYSGSDGNELHTFPSPLLGDLYGFSVAGAGDVNGDGIPDVIVGSPFASVVGIGSTGLVYVYSGSSAQGYPALALIHGQAEGDWLGWSVAGAGDVNGDGLADVIAGAPQADGPGYARIFFGIAGGPMAPGPVLHATSSPENFGWCVAAAGDVNLDGLDDVIVGSPMAFEGMATIRSVMADSILFTFRGMSPGDMFGFSLARAGDVNGDGIQDFLVGAILPQSNGAGYAQVRSIAGVPAGGGHFGSGCAPSGTTPAIATAGGPATVSAGNSNFALLLSNAPPSSLSILIVGSSNVSWLGIPLPMNLGPLGFAGCSLLVAADAMVHGQTTASGARHQPLPVPVAPALVGQTVHFQWGVVHFPTPGSPPTLAMTEGLSMLLQ